MQPFTPQNTALLLIDHQVGTMQLIRKIDRNMAEKQAVALAKMTKILGILTILTASQAHRVRFFRSCLAFCRIPMRHASSVPV